MDFALQCLSRELSIIGGSINFLKFCSKNTMIVKDTILIHITHSILNRCI